MSIEEIKKNKLQGATHYIDSGGFCYCKYNNGWMAFEYGEWVYCSDFWLDKIKPIF